MLRRRCGAVMDEEYVQEHILTGGIVAPVGGASPSDSWPLTAIFLLGVGGGGIHGVPGPLAGAGLPFNAIGYGILAWVRRRRGAN
jgi:hypothetical protein